MKKNSSSISNYQIGCPLTTSIDDLRTTRPAFSLQNYRTLLWNRRPGKHKPYCVLQTLLGYLENLGSDRRIINTASMRLDVLYFLGYNIDEPLHWHSTLSRTRQLYGEDVFKELFKKVLKMRIDKGMVSGRTQAVDSALIKANASMDSIAEKEIMSDAEHFVDDLTSNEEGKPQKVSAYKKKKVEEHHRWKEKAYKGQPATRSVKFKEEHGSDNKSPKFLSNHAHEPGFQGTLRGCDS